MGIKTFRPTNLSAINKKIAIHSQRKGSSVVWFRGQEDWDWPMLPIIFRKYNLEVNSNNTYGNIHLTEDYRFHSFRAKTGHQISTNPGSVLEWTEIMQHHEMSTRLLDWSEAMMNGLLFALEAHFLDQNAPCVKSRRQAMKPVLWALFPQVLNDKVFELITTPEGGHYTFIERALETLVPAGSRRLRLAYKIGNELKSNPKTYFTDALKKNISGLVNVPALEEVRRIYGNGLLPAVENFEFNPFYFILLRLYSDRLPIGIKGKEPDKILPPLASIHQYHSQRIQAQKGVFLIMPEYLLDQNAEDKRTLYNIDLRSMQCQPNCYDALLKFELYHHEEIAKELKVAGEHRYSNYPEVPEYARSIELGV